ncbi:MAG: beta-galactosidase [Clostridia bacterium]|nr:beta-galactosidase [Clostridia bacterium]
MSSAPVYSWNTQYLSRDDKPFLPMMGEFHYARYPKDEWRKELEKMKACGVDIVATYVFWIHHEAEEGVFDFSDRRCLHDFIEECRAVGLPVWLRIGPWCHGECRHGGFPEWLMTKGIPTRCSDSRYLALVRRLWEQVFAQVRGMFLKDGGPIIGVQIENEYGHCGGSGENSHMDDLLAMAKEIGFITPYYTATGWGGAVIGSLLPVMACYCDAPWDRSLEALPPSPNYIFSHERNDVDVGSDFERGANVSFDEDAYPYLLAEMGGGIGSTFHRRPTAIPADTGAMSLVKLGSGANLLGYYMYHGGINPGPELNETRESGSFCETPTLSYSPHAPIGEGGQIDDLAKELKLLSMFLRSYGEMLAPMAPDIPDCSAKQPADTESPRYALRMKDGVGFAFVNNHQRCLELPERTIDIPGLGVVTAPSGYYGILPIRIPVGDAAVSSRTASPLCILNGSTYVFYGEPQFAIDGSLGKADILTLTRREALDAWAITKDGREQLIICSAPVIEHGGAVTCLARCDTPWYTTDGAQGVVKVPQEQSSVVCRRKNVNYLCYDYELNLSYSGDAEEVYLRADYEGSLAELFVDGEKVADDIYDGSLWEIALTRYGRPAKATLRVYAHFEGMPCWLQNPPAYQDGRALRLKNVTVENEYRCTIEI